MGGYERREEKAVEKRKRNEKIVTQRNINRNKRRIKSEGNGK